MLGQARQNLSAAQVRPAGGCHRLPFRRTVRCACFSRTPPCIWVKDAEASSVKCIAAALRHRRKICSRIRGQGEYHGNPGSVCAPCFGDAAEDLCPWTFRGIGEYATVLERHGLEVRQASPCSIGPRRWRASTAWKIGLRCSAATTSGISARARRRKRSTPWWNISVRSFITKAYGPWIYRRLRVVAYQPETRNEETRNGFLSPAASRRSGPSTP